MDIHIHNIKFGSPQKFRKPAFGPQIPIFIFPKNPRKHLSQKLASFKLSYVNLDNHKIEKMDDENGK